MNSIKAQLKFKKALLQFARELVEEAQDEMVATMYHEMGEVLLEEVTKLSHEARLVTPVKKVVRAKKTRKKSGSR